MNPLNDARFANEWNEYLALRARYLQFTAPFFVLTCGVATCAALFVALKPSSWEIVGIGIPTAIVVIWWLVVIGQMQWLSFRLWFHPCPGCGKHLAYGAWHGFPRNYCPHCGLSTPSFPRTRESKCFLPRFVRWNPLRGNEVIRESLPSISRM